MNVIFLDIDGVLNNHGCYRPGNIDQFGRCPDPSCIAALNYVVSETGAVIVVSSTWRISGVQKMRETLQHWGVSGFVFDVTPRLETAKGDITLSVPRGREIQTWLDRIKDFTEVDRFVILDDDSDMEHHREHLVQTDFEYGLTMAHARMAIAHLQEDSEG